MSCPKETKVRTDAQGNDIYEYTDATTGNKETFLVPQGHIYRCIKGVWTVMKKGIGDDGIPKS